MFPAAVIVPTLAPDAPETAVFFISVSLTGFFQDTLLHHKEIALSRSHFCLILSLFVLVGLLPSSSSQANAPVLSEFGVNSHIASRYNNYYVMHWPADVIASSGAGWVREDFHWFWIEPQDGRFQWDYYDRMVELYSARNTNIIGVLGHPPGWGTLHPNDDPAAPSFYAPDPELFADFAAEVVKRYRYKVLHWEIWNEPDNPQFWLPHPDPVAYAQLLSTVYMRVKEVAPEVNILMGGINPFDSTFLRTIAEIGAWWSFDIINIHPYVDPAMPEDNGGIGHSAMEHILSVMNRAGSKPVWVTEYGWSSKPSDRDPVGIVNEHDQANYLVRGAVLLRAAGAQRILWYSMKDEQHNGYGMMRFAQAYDDYSQPRPSYNAFSNLNQQLAGAGFKRPLHEVIKIDETAEVYALRFSHEQETIDVIWSLQPTMILLPTPHASAQVFNRDGAAWQVEAESGMLHLFPDDSPLYVRQPR